MFKSKGNHCQSCGMPLSKNKKDNGSEKDGSLSEKYCNHCYINGEFTDPSITVDQMRDKVYNKLKEMHFPGFFAKMLTNDINKLDRWKI